MKTIRNITIFCMIISTILLATVVFVYALELGTDRPGMDYKDFDLSSPDPKLCEDACKADSPKCKAFTYVKPGIQGPSARCWLKSGVPAAVKNDCCVSGIKGRGAFVRDSSKANKVLPDKLVSDKPKLVAEGQLPKNLVTGQGPNGSSFGKGGGGIGDSLPGANERPTIEGKPGGSPFGSNVAVPGKILGMDTPGGDAGKSIVGKNIPSRPQDQLTQKPDKLDMMMRSPEWKSKMGNIGPGKYADGDTGGDSSKSGSGSGGSGGSSEEWGTTVTLSPGLTKNPSQVSKLADQFVSERVFDEVWSSEGRQTVVGILHLSDDSGYAVIAGPNFFTEKPESEIRLLYGLGNPDQPIPSGWVQVIQPMSITAGGGKKEGVDGTDTKFDPRTIDPKLRELLAKYAPKRHTDPRLGHVGDPMRVASATAKGADGGTRTNMAGPGGGGGKVQPTWVFGGMKPGWTLIGPRDPDLPGTTLPTKPEVKPRDILPDPMEMAAIKGAQAEMSDTAGKASTMVVTSVTGSVEKLTEQGGRQTWASLKVGDTIGPGTIVRVDNKVGGAIGVGGDFGNANKNVWIKFHSDDNSSLNILKGHWP